MRPPGTCPGGLPETPLPVDNPAGLPALRARIGDFASFQRTMLERIAAQPELAGLTTRDQDDHAITLLEQWAALGDVLTFHQERYVNEHFLGTAVLDESVHRLVELIGYRPRPGVSATATLAFTLAAGAALTVPAGFPVQSVPGPGEQPQTFETLEGCAADWRLNALPAYGKPVAVDPLAGAEGALVHPADVPRWAGVLRPGDPMLVVVEGPESAHVKIGGSGTRETGSVLRTTVAALDAGPDGLRLRLAAQTAAAGAAAYRPARSLLVNGHDVPDTAPPIMSKNGDKITWDVGKASEVEIAAGAPLPLERKNESLAVGTPLLVVDPGAFTRVVRVTKTAPGTEQLLGATGPTSQVAEVTVDPELPKIADRRKVQVVQLDGEAVRWLGLDHPDRLGNELWIPGLAVATAPPPPAEAEANAGAAADSVQVLGPPGTDRAAAPVVAPADLPRGRRLVLAAPGGRAVATTVQGGVRLEPAGADPAAGGVRAGDACYLVVPLAAQPEDTDPLDAAATTLLGNAATASHGVTVPHEVLGSGDASSAFQRFALAHGPLTRVPAATPEGSVTALTVRVGGLASREVPQLLGAGPDQVVYELRTEADGSTVVQYGDGTNGARPRSGAGNVVADYRYGAGLAGRVGAGTLTQPLHRLPGLDAVANPAAAQGGADREDGSALRERAPGTVRVLGRAVSAADCADLLVATGQVAKARAATVWDGRGLLIAVTVAGPAGGTFDPAGRRLLARTVASASPPYRRVVVQDFTPVPLVLAVTVAPGPAAEAETVLAGVRAALAGRLGFDRTDLARALHLSDLYLAAAAVPGAATVTVTRFGFARPPGTPDAVWAAFLADHGADPADGDLPERLRLLDVRAGAGGGVLPAELPVLAPDQLTVTLAAAPPAPTTGGLT
ncbi:putative phage baseplate assembly protein [Streptomyces sp. 1114.5]|uniref:baseplate J/gp47 family protein n=1 Tax=Streptomyces sp. 1114.5 TaxID=1938830 RepID=UPI000EB5858D|nr:baseplate J/gp47 family protein [Streptomyces sp. 1114.5]RKT20011.1 putative phage baseplate assembly protein [Streptomyces sp. 1114.5]